jgi:hypothetical protein
MHGSLRAAEATANAPLSWLWTFVGALGEWLIETTLVPFENPFTRMELSYKPKVTRAATYEELIAFVTTADALGYCSIGTAALIAFFWLQREEDIFLRLAWSHYRPNGAPNSVCIFHHKNGEIVDVPLYDEDGVDLWPDLVPRLDSEPRIGTLLVMRDKPDRRRKVHLPWATSAVNPVRHVQRIVAKIREAAGLPPEITSGTAATLMLLMPA